MSKYYDIKLDNISIYDPSNRYLAMLNPKVSLQLGAAGSAEFTLPPDHTFYNEVVPYGSSIEIFEDGESIFFGRPLPPTIDFYKRKTFHVEGALSFLNDVVVVEQELGDVTCGYLLERILRTYNTNVRSNSNRIIKARSRIDGDSQILGTVEHEKMIYDLTLGYDTTFDIILKTIHQYVGGYFYTYRYKGNTYLDWVDDAAMDECNQPIVFQMNLIDLVQTGKTFYTAVLPEGIENSQGKKPLVTNAIRMSNDVINKFGFICCHKQFQWSNSNLLEDHARSWLHSQQIEGYSFEVTALDEHIIDGDYDQFKLMHAVHVNSVPHAVDAVLPITKLDIDLASPAKIVTVGTQEKPSTIRSIQKVKRQTERVEKEMKKQKDRLNSATGSASGSYTSPDGNTWEPSIDNNGNMTYVKIPIKIFYSRTSPYWNIGDTFDLTKFTVLAQYGDGSTEDVTDRCTFNIENGKVFAEDEADMTYTLTASYDPSAASGTTGTTGVTGET